MRGLIRLLLVAGVIAGLWWLLRELLEEPTAESPPDTAEGPKDTTAAAENSASSNGSASVSKAELYRQAQELDVAGRSKMNKEQLAEAIAAARRA